MTQDNKCISLEEFLKRCRQVTNNHLYAEGGVKWDNNFKIDEELEEYRNATSTENKIEEGWDIIYAVLTDMHMHFTDKGILNGGILTLEKIESRARHRFEEERRCRATQRLGV